MSSAIGRAWFTMRKPRTLRRLTIRRAGFRQRDILKAAGAAAIELLFARSAPRLGAGGAGVGGDKTFSTCVKRSHGGVGGGWRTSSHITVGHAPTCEVTIFIFRSKFLSYSREGLAGGPTDEQLFARQNFLCPAMGLSYPDMSLC
jgi:hypothetical protein